MLKHRYYLIPALLVGSFGPLQASSVVCSLETGSGNPFVSQSCNNIVSPTASMNWSSVLSSNSGQVAGPVTGSLGGDSFTLGSSTSVFEGAVDDALAWNGAAWYPAFTQTTATTFAGHFNSNTTDVTGVANTSLGDNLLGVVTATGTTNNNAAGSSALFTFSKTLSYVEFQVSSESGTDSNFNAQLWAYSSNGTLLGIYQAADTGGGGLCPTLSPSNPSQTNPPVACNDAATVQFYDPQDRIAEVLIVVNDNNGFFVDTLQGSPVPEPSTFMMFGIGFFALLCVAQRNKLGGLVRWSGSSTRDKVDAV